MSSRLSALSVPVITFFQEGGSAYVSCCHLKFEILLKPNSFFFFFFYLGFLSRTFTIHGTAGKGGGYLFNSSLPLPPASQTLRH